jgi:hypothetical protein
MKVITTIVVFLAIVMATVLVDFVYKQPDLALAYECNPLVEGFDVDGKFERHDFVFLGVLKEIDYSANLGIVNVAIFEVEHVWKGTVLEKVYLQIYNRSYDPFYPSSEIYEHDIGEKYLIFANTGSWLGEDYFSHEACNSPTRFDYAQEYIEELNTLTTLEELSGMSDSESMGGDDDEGESSIFLSDGVRDSNQEIDRHSVIAIMRLTLLALLILLVIIISMV